MAARNRGAPTPPPVHAAPRLVILPGHTRQHIALCHAGEDWRTGSSTVCGFVVRVDGAQAGGYWDGTEHAGVCKNCLRVLRQHRAREERGRC